MKAFLIDGYPQKIHKAALLNSMLQIMFIPFQYELNRPRSRPTIGQGTQAALCTCSADKYSNSWRFLHLPLHEQF